MDRTEDRIDWRSDRVLWLIVALAAFWGLVYNFVIMRGFGPDELRHIAYVKLLLDDHRLPYMFPNGTELKGAHSEHPPLYYICQLPFFALGRALFGQGEYHLMRLLSMAMCLIALPLVYQIAFVGSGRDRNTARLVTAIIGLLPIYGMFMGDVDNDSGLVLACVVFLWLLAVKYPRDTSLKSAAVLGVVFGLGGLTKGTALLYDFSAFGIYLLVQGGRRALVDWRAWLRLMIVLGIGALICGWWYYRNHVLYGEFQPIPHGLWAPNLPNPSNGILVMMMHDNFPGDFLLVVEDIFYTVWAQVDWIPATINLQIYIGLAAFCFAALMGNLMRHFKKRPASVVAGESIACSAGYVSFVFVWMSCVYIALFVHFGIADGGRYLIPASAGAALFVARGWRGLVGDRGLKYVVVLWIIALCLLNWECVHTLVTYLNPKYG